MVLAWALVANVHAVRNVENWARDAAARLRAPRSALEVAVVYISEDDYHGRFDGTSPLDTDTLAAVLQSILNEAPEVVVVDLLVDSPRSVSLQLDAAVPLVWARPMGDGGGACPAANPQAEHGVGEVGGDPLFFGLPELVEDRDGVVRRYQAYFDVSGCSLPSLAEAAWQLRLGSPDQEREPDASERFIRYRRGAETGISLDLATLSDMRESAPLGERGATGRRDRGPLSGKVVVLGGRYDEARDAYVTPIGRLHGVDVHAQIIQSLAEGGGARSLGRGGIGLLFALNSLALILVFNRVRRLRTAVGIALGSIPLFAMASAWILGDEFLSYLPYLGVLLAAVLVDQARQRFTSSIGRRTSP